MYIYIMLYIYIYINICMYVYIYMLHIRPTCPCFMSMLPCCMPLLHVHTACPCFPCCWSMPQVNAAWCPCACPYCLFMLHALVACPCCMYTLHVHVAYPCCMPAMHMDIMQHLLVAWTSSMSMQHGQHWHAACTCNKGIQQGHVTRASSMVAWTWSMGMQDGYAARTCSM
jgi:hypothetical protein